MKESGILFTPENIKLIRDSRKWKTRRVMNPQWTCDNPDSYTVEMALRHCRHGKIGDRLYVKEGVIVWDGVKKLVGYYMDGCRPTMRGHKRLTAMFMPKWAARTWLEITEVRIERLQNISEADCIAEGCPKEYLIGVNWYKHLWDEINGKKHPWASNPFVWCLSFKVVKP